jgi:spermidine synthase
MGGLAIGAWIAARANGQVDRPIRMYAVLQVCIGVYTLASIPLMRSIEPLVNQLAAPAGAMPLLTLAVVFALVASPAVLMGMAFPVLAGEIVRGQEEYAPRVGMLYALNTIGAVTGTVLAGFVILPLVGLSATCWIAGGIDMMVGAVALRVDAATGLRSRDGVHGGVNREWRWRQRLAAGLFACSGAAALIYEVGWFRLLALAVGPSTQAFSAMLAMYLAGLAIGTGVASVAIHGLRVSAWTLFGVIQCLLAFVVVLTSYGLNQLPRLQTAVFPVANAMFGVAGPAVSLLVIAGVVVFVPCLLMGALFPLMVRAVAELGPAGTPEHDVGWLYGVNTIGAIAGSLAAAFLIIPWLGTWNTLLGAGFVSAIIGSAALVFIAGRRRLAIVAASLVAVGLLAWNAPSWDVRTFNAGAYRHAYAGRLFDFRAESAVLYFREGLNFPVAVLAMDGDASLRITGKADASTGLLDRATQALLGHVPMLLAQHSSRVAVVGYGSGGTAAAILAHPAVESLTIIELEPAVLEASRLFASINKGAIQDPRVRVVVADARAYLARTNETFDVISAEPSNPWLAGMGNLFTVEFFESVRERLAIDGVFCQWIQSYEISEDVFRAIVGSLHAVFPHLVLVRASAAGDWMVLASASPIAVPWETVASRFEAVNVSESLSRIGLTHPLQFAAHVRSTSGDLRDLVRSRRLTDDDVWLEYTAFADLVSGAAAGRGAAVDTMVASASADRLMVTWGRVLQGIPVGACVEAVTRYLYSGELVNSTGGEVFDPMQRDRNIVLDGLRAEIAAVGDDSLRAAFEAGERRERAAWERRVEGARVLAGNLNGNPRERFTAIARVLETSPDLPLANAMAGRVFVEAGIYPEAVVFLQRVLHAPPNAHYYDAMTQLGHIAARRASAGIQTERAQAIRWFRQAIAWNPYRPDAFVALSEVYRARGELEAAKAVLREGKTFNPQDVRMAAPGTAVGRPAGTTALEWED